ncbi:MAG: transglycosylase domain-containing protein [Bacteroidales bacterium]|nr:transglycosylase domain-containing protein [Bacteroidales bacterium]
MSKTNINRKKFNKYFWIIFAAPFALLALLLLLAAVGGMGYMPDINTLENPKINLASQVISDDGKVLGSFYYRNQNRTYVDYDELPDHLVKALIATEDKRFYRHSGIDARGIARMVIKTGLLMQRSSGGGSTITQQLAKMLFHEPPRTMFGRGLQKIKEWIIAVRLEKAYTKEEIITMYFNQCDFVNEAAGIKSAAQVYFSTLPDSLTVEQAAMLVGMAKNPSFYNPNDSNRRERVQRRRNVVLNQMEKYSYISTDLADSLKGMPLTIKFQRVAHDQGLATYFREHIRTLLMKKEPKRKDYYDYDLYREDSLKWMNDPLFGWCNKNKKPDGNPYNLYTDGLKIYSTVNTKMQQYAEEAMKEHLGGYLQPAFFKEKRGAKRAPFSRDLQDKDIDRILTRAMLNSDRGRSLKDQGLTTSQIYKEFKKSVPMKVFSWRGDIDTTMSPLDSIRYYKHFLRAGFMAMEPLTGHVKAYVGGIDFASFKYDHVSQSKRQAGSTFKPFLYILAMQEGRSPCDEVPNISQTFMVNDTVWTPRSNSREKDLGKMKTLKWGLATSENNISAWLIKEFKPKPIADVAHKMGITSYIDPVPSMIYGTSDMTVAEMVSSYATLANRGEHIKPAYITRIEDKNGNILAEFTPEKMESISEQTAFLMLNLLEGVTNFGTAVRLRYAYHFTAQIAAKTGTTQNHSDGWMIGITPKLVAGGWVGAEDRSVHFDGMTMGQGATMALPIYALFMQRVYADKSLGITQNDVFQMPSGMAPIPDCRDIVSPGEGEDYYWENEW